MDAPEGLRELQRLVHHALLLLVVPHLRISRQREILSEWMSIEPIIREDPPQVRMILEENPIQIKRLSFVPIRASEYRHRARNGRYLASVGLDADTAGMFDAEEVINDFETFVAFRVVGSGDVHELLVLATAVVAEEGEDLEDGGWGAVKRKLVSEDGELLDMLG